MKTKKINKVKKNITQKVEIDFKSFEKSFEKKHKLSSNISNKKNNKKVAKQIYNFYHKSKFSPKDDFYDWVNYDWLTSFKTEDNPEYIVQFDDFRLVQHKVYLQLFQIIKDYLKTHTTSPFDKCLSNFYHSSQKTSTLHDLREDLSQTIRYMDQVREDKKNAWKMLAYFNQSELYSWGCPFVLDIGPDAKDPTTFCCNVSSAQFSLIDSNIYFNDGTDVEYKLNYKKHFLKYIKNLFELVLGKDNGLNEEDVFNVECKLINSFGCTSEKEEEHGYNRISTQDALKKYNFDFATFCKELGFKKIPKWFVVNSLNYLSCASKIYLENWDTKEFRTYWIFNYLRQTSLFCKESRDVVFEFNGKFVRGQEKNYDTQDIKGYYGLGLAFNTFLTNKYVENYTNEHNIKYLKNIAEDLKKVFMRIVRRNTWLNPKTKHYALLKLKHLQLIIGSPKLLRKDPILPYTSDYLANIKMICDWRFKELISLEGKSTKDIDIPTIDWSQYPPKFTGSQAYVVNAYYTPIKNSIYVPLGYIHAPFVDLKERGLEYNLAHIGITLGHEMSHSLDNWGSQYDYKGRLFDWWTREDKIKFKKIQKDVVNQYELFAKRDGITFDAEPGLGEDMADISGLAICNEYLRDFQEYTKDIVPIQNLSYRKFYIYYASQYREKISKRALDSQLKTNPHPLDKYRTNIPLSRLSLFREIYDVSKKDKMWWHNTNTIW